MVSACVCGGGGDDGGGDVIIIIIISVVFYLSPVGPEGEVRGNGSSEGVGVVKVACVSPPAGY